MKKLAQGQGFDTTAQDSNPGSRSREANALPLSHYALQEVYIQELKIICSSGIGILPEGNAILPSTYYVSIGEYLKIINPTDGDVEPNVYKTVR